MIDIQEWLEQALLEKVADEFSEREIALRCWLISGRRTSTGPLPTGAAPPADVAIHGA